MNRIYFPSLAKTKAQFLVRGVGNGKVTFIITDTVKESLTVVDRVWQRQLMDLNWHVSCRRYLLNVDVKRYALKAMVITDTES